MSRWILIKYLTFNAKGPQHSKLVYAYMTGIGETWLNPQILPYVGNPDEGSRKAI